METKNFWGMEGEDGLFIRIQDRAEYETKSHDYEGNIVEGAVCAIEIEDKDMSLEECEEIFVKDGLEFMLNTEKDRYMVLFEGIKFEEIEDGVICKQDYIRKIWNIKNKEVVFDMDSEGGHYL